MTITMIKWVSSSVHRYFRIPYTLNTYEFKSPRRPKATYVLIHGIGNNLHSWDEVVSGMPDDVRVVGIDLLGFGGSPRPSWAVYSAKTQARSVGATLLKIGALRGAVLVGHSLGALVSVEVAKRYPVLVNRLVLCSPPFYAAKSQGKTIKKPEDILRDIYNFARKYPKQLMKMSALAVKLGVANKTLVITEDTITSYLATLESSIINQTSLEDVASIDAPIDIFYGTMDAFVINRHITRLGKSQSNVTTHKLIYGHEVIGGYARAVGRFLTNLAASRKL